ncbi:MAG: hypothetical protein M3389_08495 [Actinomycetota bacterium]|nr:hypothetical protein [Actinomycetota bacterium]
MLEDLEFAGATIYRQATMSNHWSWGVGMAPVTSLFVGPHTEVCSWGHGCTTRGSATDRFGAQNRLGVWAGPLDGFNVILSCDIPDSTRRCDANGSEVFRLFGGRAALRDTATPKVTHGPTGTLVTDATLGGTETLGFGATDAGAGLYRVRITIDGATVATRVLQGAAECVDRNPANGDPYEFAVRRPCALSATPSQQYDTSGWPRSGRLRILLEDAGRNSTVLVNRRVG